MTTEQDEARRLAERIVRGDADSSLPSVYESHRLTLARALLRLLDALDAAEGSVPRCSICRRNDCHQNHACE